MIPGIVATGGFGAPASGGGFPTDGLVAYYPFEGNANDTSGNGRHGTPNFISYAAGKVGDEGVFTSASPSNIALPSACKLPGAFTFASWLMPSTLSPGTGVVVIWQDWSGSERNYQLSMVSGGRIELLVGNGGGASDGAIGIDSAMSVSERRLLVVTRNGANRKMYLGETKVLDVNATYTGGATSSGNTSRLGADGPQSPGYGWGGRMDETGLWNRELTEEEITYLNNSGDGRTYPE